MPPNNAVVLDRTVQSSNMQPAEKSAIHNALATLAAPSRAMVAMSQPASFLEFAAETAISGATGVVLGAMHAELKDGLDRNGKPIDGVVAAVTAVAGGVFGSKAAQEICKTSTGILLFRKTEQFLSIAKKFSKQPDVIEEAGKGV